VSVGLTELGKALGQPALWEWDGRTWQIGPVDFDLEMRFSAALQARTAEGLRRNSASLGPVHADAVRQYNDDLAAGEFDWDGRVGTAARQSLGGTAELVHLCLSRNHRDWTREHLRRLLREPAPVSGDPVPFLEAVQIVRRLTEPPPNGQGPAAPPG
jgi:hypothetical protein